MPPRRRGLTEADLALWTAYARQVAPLAKGAVAPVPSPAGRGMEAATPERTSDPAATPAHSRPTQAAVAPSGGSPSRGGGALEIGGHPGGLDRATWQRLRAGKLRTERTLDLHGLTVQRAHQALTAFLRGAHAQQLRCVEVITGRGSGDSSGAIRREFTHWLNQPELRALILGATHPHARNAGSVRLLLRRAR